VASVVLSSKSPVDIGEDGLLIIVYYAKDAAAYFGPSLTAMVKRNGKGVYQLLVQI
jgi:hypothetical protein